MISKEIIVTILLSVLFGGTSLVGLGNADMPLDPAILRLRYLLVGSSLIIAIVISPFKKWGFPRKSLPLLALWGLFCLGLVISGLANNDSTPVRDGLWLMIGVPIIFFNALPKVMNENAGLLMGLALVLGHLPYIITSLVVNPPINPSLYRGVFANSNQLGFTSSTIVAGLLILSIGTLPPTKRDIRYILPLVLSLAVVLGIIVLANSRTSQIVCLAMFAIFAWQLFHYPKLVMKIVLTVSATALLIILLASERIDSMFKNTNNLEAKQGLSGRDYIWGKTLDDSNFLGHGSNYFHSNFGMGGHNTIIEILGQNGIIAAYLLIIFAAASLLYAYGYFKKHRKQNSYAIAPLLITVCFWISSMAEGMFGSLGNAQTLAYMLSVGIVIADSRSELQPSKYQTSALASLESSFDNIPDKPT